MMKSKTTRRYGVPLFNIFSQNASKLSWGGAAVHGRAGHREQLGQIADRVIAGVVHAAQLLLLSVGQLGLLALELAPGAGDRHAFAPAQPDQVGLELSEGGQDVEEHLPSDQPGHRRSTRARA